MKLLALLAIFLVLPALADLHTLADISGSSAAVALASSSTRVSWIQCIAPSGNMNVARFGDSTVSSSRGFPIAAGGGYNTPVGPAYDLAATYVYVVTGDKLSCGFGN
jgi:hypothetical protein